MTCVTPKLQQVMNIFYNRGSHIGRTNQRRFLFIALILISVTLLKHVDESKLSCNQLPCRYNYLKHSRREKSLKRILASMKFKNTTDSKYRIYEDVFVSEDRELSKKFHVCIATFSSIERLMEVEQSSKYWQGPVSIAVFLRNSQEVTMAEEIVNYLRWCSTTIRLNFSIHFMVGKQVDIGRNMSLLPNKLNCIRRPDIHPNETLTVPVPQNHLRNVARDGCERLGVKYFYLTDVDIIPKPKLASQLNSYFANRKQFERKEIFIVPTYELDKSVTIIPNRKENLLQLVSAKLARPFHVSIFSYNQLYTNHSRWEKLPPLADDKLEVAYNVSNYKFYYEPFYVAPFGVPRHDERFVGFGFTRNTQVFETYMAGYCFSVFGDAFAIHPGLQTGKSRTSWRKNQVGRNAWLVEKFVRDLQNRYNKSAIEALPNDNLFKDLRS